MFWQIILAVPIILTKPDVAIKWLTDKPRSLSINVSGQDPIQDSCLSSGSVLRYVYRVQICKRRPAWFDNCQSARKLDRRAQLDPITRNYNLRAYWDGDKTNHLDQNFDNRSEMLSVLRTYPDLDLKFLAFNVSEYVNSQRSYVSIRVTSECQGEYNKTLATISKVLSFGLASIHGFDTGWIDFKLRDN